MWSLQVAGVVNEERGGVRREKVETNKFFYGPVGSGPEKVWNLPLEKEMAGLMEGRRDGDGQAR